MRDFRKIEKLQYKALKYVYNDFKSSYTDLRKKANRPLMYVERQRCILLEVYKCLNQICPRYLRDMFEIKVMPYNLRNESIVIMPKYNFIKYVRYSILYDGAALWNALDKRIVNAQSVADFKTMMQTWGVITCTHTHVITLEQTSIIKQTFKVCLKILYYLSLSRLIKLNHCFNFTINCIACV